MNALMPEAKRLMLRKLENEIAALRATPERHDCGACDHFVDSICQRWNAAPPAEVQPVGCDAFESTVPF